MGEKIVEMFNDFREDMKKRLLLERGETLIAVPCWWDGSSDR